MSNLQQSDDTTSTYQTPQGKSLNPLLNEPINNYMDSLISMAYNQIISDPSQIRPEGIINTQLNQNQLNGSSQLTNDPTILRPEQNSAQIYPPAQSNFGGLTNLHSIYPQDESINNVLHHAFNNLPLGAEHMFQNSQMGQANQNSGIQNELLTQQQQPIVTGPAQAEQPKLLPQVNINDTNVEGIPSEGRIQDPLQSDNHHLHYHPLKKLAEDFMYGIHSRQQDIENEEVMPGQTKKKRASSQFFA